MSRNKPYARKRRLVSAESRNIAGPIWAILRKFGKRRTHRWRLNPHENRDWRHDKLNK